MAFQQKDNSGALFKNEKKESEKHPDYQGNCMVDGTEYFMSAWIKTAESGRRWMSFSFKQKEDKNNMTKGQKEWVKDYTKNEPKRIEDMEDDIPF